jgi:hypothetical protein
MTISAMRRPLSSVPAANRALYPRVLGTILSARAEIASLILRAGGDMGNVGISDDNAQSEDMMILGQCEINYIDRRPPSFS